MSYPPAHCADVVRCAHDGMGVRRVPPWQRTTMTYDPSDERFHRQTVLWVNAVFASSQADRLLARIHEVEKNEIVEPDEVLLLGFDGQIERAWSSPEPRPAFLQDEAAEYRRVGVFTYLRSP